MADQSDFDRLEEAYGRLKDDRRAARKRIAAEYAAEIDSRVDQYMADLENGFAGMIALVVSRGATHSEIREKALHTTSWDTWKYWREKAGLKPEREFWFHNYEAKGGSNGE